MEHRAPNLPPPKSPAGSSSSEEDSEEGPWTILNHIPPGPGEDRMVRQERVFLFQGNPRTEPKVLHLFSDGSFSLQNKAHPSELDQLELVGHSRGQVCFRNLSQRQILVWDLEAQRVRKVLDDVTEGGESSYGFGHRNGGLFMVVRLGRQPLFHNMQGFGYYLHTFIEREREQWTRDEVRLEAVYDFRTFGPAILVSQNGMLYWKAVSAQRAYIITYDLQTELVGRLVAPEEDNLDNVELVLGHGFKGQLAASVYVPPENQGHSYLHIWVLLKELAMYHWHKLVALPCHDYTSDGEVLVPLVFYYDREGGEINLLVHRNKEEVVHMIPAKKRVKPLADAEFRRVPVPSAIPSGIKMQLGSRRMFQATPLVKPMGNRALAEDNNTDDDDDDDEG